jgi:phage terminase small subunit
LSEAERTIFLDLVTSCSPRHFQQSDMPLLVRYCETATLADQAAEHIRQEGAVVAGRLSPWVTAQEKAIRALTALSMRLRLSPQAREPNRPSRKQPTSYYERMSIDEKD